MERISRVYKRWREHIIRGPKVEGFSVLFRILVTCALAIVASNVVAFNLHLSNPIRYVIMIVLCAIVMVIVDLKPRLLLTIVCVMLLFIGVAFTLSSMSEEDVGGNIWDSGLLGVGVSLVALSAAVYVLQDQVGSKGNASNMSGSGRDIHDSKKDGYVWVEESRKYRCEYCRDSGRYRYYETLNGIKKHIAREHVERKI